MTYSIIITLVCIGIVAGLLSGLVGIGGGIILVPCLIYFMQYTQHQAQGTSLGVLSLPVVALAFWHYYTQLKNTPNAISTTVIIILAIGFIVGGLIGSKVALRLDQQIIKKIFAIILFYTAFKMLEWDTYLINLFKKN